MQAAQLAAFFGQQQQAGGVTVEAVHQLQLFTLWPELPERLNDAELKAASTVHGNAGWFVDHQQLFVFVHNGGFQPFQQATAYRRWLVGRWQAKRRDTDDIAGLQPVLGFDTLLVGPYLAFAQDTVNQGFRCAFKVADEKVVDALTGKAVPDFDKLDPEGF